MSAATNAKQDSTSSSSPEIISPANASLGLLSGKISIDPSPNSPSR